MDEWNFRHVSKALKVLMKNVQPAEDIEVDEGDLDDMVRPSPFFACYSPS